MNVSAEQLREREKPFYSYLEERKKLLLSFASRIHNIKSYFLFLATNDEISMVYAIWLWFLPPLTEKLVNLQKDFIIRLWKICFSGNSILKKMGKNHFYNIPSSDP